MGDREVVCFSWRGGFRREGLLIPAGYSGFDFGGLPRGNVGDEGYAGRSVCAGPVSVWSVRSGFFIGACGGVGILGKYS